jgi:lipopolysaccharide export system permease protein
MRRIDRYIVSTVASSILLVLSIVLLLDLVFAFVAEVDELKADYQIMDAIYYLIATIPRRFYDYLPLGIFMGCLIGLGGLGKNSELVVLRAAGVSTLRIFYAAFKPALAAIVIGVLIGEHVAPYTETVAQSRKAIAQGASQNIRSEGGLWHREGSSYFHFNAVEPNGVLHGITIQEFDQGQQLIKSVFAERAIYQRNHWLLENVSETRFESRERISTSTYKSYPLTIDLSPALLGVLMVKPENLSVTGLYSYIQYLQSQSLNSSEYALAFWKKVLQPIATAALVLIAISFVFGPLRSVTMGFRIFCGLIVGLVFKYVQDLLGPSSLVFGFEPIYATLIPIALCLVAGVFLLRRAR